MIHREHDTVYRNHFIIFREMEGIKRHGWFAPSETFINGYKLVIRVWYGILSYIIIRQDMGCGWG